MPRKKRKSKLRPKLPSRVKKRTKRAERPAGRQHPELWGLVLVALGLFLGSVVYAGWNGGYVGGAIADGLRALVGGAAWLVPVVLVVLGALMVGRSALVDVRPFRTGLAVLACGLMVTLGKDEGGYLGQLLGGAVGVAIGSTILGILLILVGALLLSGASLGAVLRRSGHQVRTRVEARRRRPRVDERQETWDDPPAPRARPKPIVDAEAAYPDVVEPAQQPALAPSPLLSVEAEPLVTQQEHLFEDETSARVAELLVQTLAHFGVEATVIGQISGPRVTRYELQLAPGTKVSKVA